MKPTTLSSPRLRWSLFFLLAMATIAILAVTWNIVLVEDHQKMQEIAKSFSNYRTQFEFNNNPWIKITLGSLGFIIVLALFIVFFIKTLKEIQSNQIYRAFLDKVSHELKSPLTTLELTSTLLQQKYKGQDSDIHELWKAHDSELKRLRTEVNLMLESSRWQNHKAKIQTQSINLESLIENMWEEWKATLGHHAHLRRQGPLLDFNIKIDPDLLKMIIQNIIDNARKYSLNKASVIVESNIDYKNPRQWYLTFRDQGLGFPPKLAPKLFEQFFRAETTAPHAISGSGLGLYLAFQAAKAMKLKLHAESPGPGQGAAFILEGTADE